MFLESTTTENAFQNNICATDDILCETQRTSEGGTLLSGLTQEIPLHNLHMPTFVCLFISFDNEVN